MERATRDTRFSTDRDGIDTMAASPEQRLTFAIDDALTVDENIAAFALKLKMTLEFINHESKMYYVCKRIK